MSTLRKIFGLAVLVIIFVMTFTVQGQTAPAINSVNGTLSEGATLNISGSSFGTKSPAKPYLWADFNSSLNPSSLGRRTAWDDTYQVKYQVGCGQDGSGCAMDSNPTSGDGPQAMVRTNGDFGAGAINRLGQKSYIYRKVKHNWNLSGYNLKTFRFWPLNAGPGPNSYVQEGNGNADTEGCSPYCWALNSNWQSNTNWVTQDILLQANSTLSSTDGILKVYMDSNIWYNCGAGGDGSHDWKMRCASTNADEAELLVLHGIIANTPTWNGTIHYYVDDIYLDDTWSRVMICAGSTWANRGHCEIQIPTAWSGTNAAIVVHPGTFANGNTAYLYLVDANNNASSGCQITIGSSGTKVCGAAAPSAPVLNPIP